jgi:hypothetical protein
LYKIAKVLRGAGGFGGSRVVGGIAGLKFAAFIAEAGQVDQAGPLQRELHRSRQDAETIFHAAAEVDGGGFLEVLRGTRHFTDVKAEVDTLGEHLVIEDEVVGIFQQWKRGEYLSAEGAISGVVLG